MVLAVDLARPTVSALLGPTNTGKTHRAILRMLEHPSGILGLPLRLLAREVYDRVTAVVGEGPVALVTGEEKRIPRNPRYWICTVEAMPTSLPVDFLAVDEIQLATHPERGHVFTARLLGARGRRETWFLGAETMRPLVSELLPEATIERHPRFSQLTATGASPIGRLPPRSAVVAFSVKNVYALAERLQRRRGGTAVVLGALSPRARNAQVALYQSGEVDYLVATDAIGMGLNLDVTHVCFSELRKFDGRRDRTLDVTEIAQIAGRAGRYRTDGTFGTLQPLPALAPNLARAIETHRFYPAERLFWRNDELDYSSIDELIASLRVPPPHPALRAIERVEDYDVLVHLARLASVRELADSPERVELLWQVCQVPDYRQLMFEAHAELLRKLFVELTKTEQRLDDDWIAAQVEHLADTRGDIETLTLRISFVRTWNYVANHPAWLQSPEHWQARTRAIEDQLSDALHEKLVERFVDTSRRSVALSPFDDPKQRGSIQNGPFASLVELRAAMNGDRGTNLGEWVESLVASPHEGFELFEDGRIGHRGEIIARLGPGSDRLRPNVTFLLADKVGAGAASRISRRLAAYGRDLVDELLAPLRGQALASARAPVRGLVYQLEKNLGTMRAGDASEQISLLSDAEREDLLRAGVVFGEKYVFVSRLLKPPHLKIRRVLCAAAEPGRLMPPLPTPATVSLRRQPGVAEETYRLVGFPVTGPRAVRCDVLERLGSKIRTATANNDEVTRTVASWLGCSRLEAVATAEALGLRPEARSRPRRRSRRRRVEAEQRQD